MPARFAEPLAALSRAGARPHAHTRTQDMSVCLFTCRILCLCLCRRRRHRHRHRHRLWLCQFPCLLLGLFLYLFPCLSQGLFRPLFSLNGPCPVCLMFSELHFQRVSLGLSPPLFHYMLSTSDTHGACTTSPSLPCTAPPRQCDRWCAAGTPRRWPGGQRRSRARSLTPRSPSSVASNLGLSHA